MVLRQIRIWTAHPWALALIRAAFAAALVVAFTLAVAPVRDNQILGSDKALHMFAFAVLALLADASFPKVRMLFLFVGLSFFGGIIEIVQGLPFVGRDCNFYDWLADMAAVALALPLARYARNYFFQIVVRH